MNEYIDTDKVIDFARSAHEGQVRKYTKEAYVEHPMQVARIVRDVLGDDHPHRSVAIAAALLHDTVEDTDTTLQDIENHFGATVAELVEQLTDVSQPADGNRKFRKEMDRRHTAKASPLAQTIKLADLIDNSDSITKHDPNFSKVYMKEKKALLQVLTKGDPRLHAQATQIVADWEAGR